MHIGNGVNDFAGRDYEQRILVAAVFNSGRLDLHPPGVDIKWPPLVTREVIDGELIWHDGSFKVAMRRIDGARFP